MKTCREHLKYREANRDNLQVLEPEDIPDENCGMTVNILTPSHIAALLGGKVLFLDDGEYTHIFGFKPDGGSK